MLDRCQEKTRLDLGLWADCTNAEDITDASVAEIISRSRGRLTISSSYWLSCAERHLATYLWEQEDYPPDAKITVDYLTPDDPRLGSSLGSGSS